MYLIFYTPSYRTGGAIILYPSILKISMAKYVLFIFAPVFQSLHRKTNYELG